MKKSMGMAVLIALLGMCACGEKERAASLIQDGTGEDPAVVLESKGTENEKEEAAVEERNRTLIAEALGVDESSRNIRFILNALKTIGAGRIQSAQMGEAEGETIVHFIGEDGTGYRMYLSGSGNVEAVKNLDRDEWVIRSEK